MSSLSASQWDWWSKSGSEEWLGQVGIIKNGLFLVLAAAIRFLLLLALPVTTILWSDDKLVEEGLLGVLEGTDAEEGGGSVWTWRVFPLLDRQSSTKTDSHSMLTSAS